MPPRKKGKKGKKSTLKFPKNPKSANSTTRRDDIKLVQSSSAASAPPQGVRTGLRSSAAAESTLLFEDNPELILRNCRKGQRAIEPAQARGRPQSPAHSDPDRPIQSIEALLDYGTPDDYSDEEAFLVDQDPDPEEEFNRKWGYLPPLDEEAAAIIDAIIADPTNALFAARMNPTGRDFDIGLQRRNVSLEESPDPDPYADYINRLPQDPLHETVAERESYEKLWILDRAKCVNGSNEALFQRTLLMSFIARHCSIYLPGTTTPPHLDFSVEEIWNCPPMPTADEFLKNKFLTQPKPVLAVCFNRKRLIPDSLWLEMPSATRRLACYEKAGTVGGSKAFHFFTIEGKRSQTALTDSTAMLQSLNNASQALHNMFRFFQDAGPQHREKFFSEVRFFSAVASTEGLNIRIHRATEVTENRSKDDFFNPGYPLRFEFREFATVSKDKFERKIILELFRKILVGYAVGKLHGLFQDAARALVEKLNDNPEQWQLRENTGFYRHGQVDNTSRSSTIQSSNASRGFSLGSAMSIDLAMKGMLRNPRGMSASQPNQSSEISGSGTATPTQSQHSPSSQASKGMLRGSRNPAASKPDESSEISGSGTATPTQNQPRPSTQISNANGKRPRSQSEDGEPPRKTRRTRKPKY